MSKTITKDGPQIYYKVGAWGSRSPDAPTEQNFVPTLTKTIT